MWIVAKLTIILYPNIIYIYIHITSSRQEGVEFWQCDLLPDFPNIVNIYIYIFHIYSTKINRTNSVIFLIKNCKLMLIIVKLFHQIISSQDHDSSWLLHQASNQLSLLRHYILTSISALNRLVFDIWYIYKCQILSYIPHFNLGFTLILRHILLQVLFILFYFSWIKFSVTGCTFLWDYAITGSIV